MGRIRVGLSGWSYAGWRGAFYPKGVARAGELAYASRCFDSLEINGSFYMLLRPHTYAAWYEQTPRGFVFAVKGSRFITHNKKLRDAEIPLANFFASGLLRLEEKLGPFVWQLSKSLVFDEERIGGFLELLPRDTEQAARLARRHDRRVAARSWTRTRRKRRLRHALEVRNETYFVPELVRLLRRHRVALVVSDAADWPLVEEVTAPFVYLRLHGSQRTYGSSYSDGEIARWAERIGRWAAGREPADAARIAEERTQRAARAAVDASRIDGGRPRAGSREKEGARSRDVYVYFDNDWHANAPRDALRLLAKLGLERECPPGPGTRRPTIRP